ncbi:GGDEF domain-containing protein [Alteromonas sp. ASW11-36]|uniref:diguanylate cyclase n=1 Tax=Alteromonas arenosi TaxID=3055817 RepID=A0ABT7SVH3_9ALTE|nr:GGDEF domain-containing protein [Alteromonas sp. ASW11-36]MDM7860198.1 GGDEF domain-containing protein [Alteromonas sp. ASW11-36]
MDYLSISSTLQSNSAGSADATRINVDSYTQPLTHAIEYTAFLNLMLATIDLDELCQNYFQYLASRLPLKRLNFAIDQQAFAFGDNNSADISITLPSTTHNRSLNAMVKTVTYSFSRRLSVQQQTLLHELHTHFCIPLGHATQYRHILQQTTRDPLTGLGNRAGFDEQIERFLGQYLRRGTRFGLLVIDLDNFKQVNDSHGHQQGDQALQAVGDLLAHLMRIEDSAFRFGGDEFCCLIHDVGESEIDQIAERIRVAAERSPLLRQHRITMSIGGTLVVHNDNAESIFARADKAVYRVKAEAKNAVFIIRD